MKEKTGIGFSSVMIPAIIILLIPKEGIKNVLKYIEYYGLNERVIRFLIEAAPLELCMTVIFGVAILVFFINLIRVIYHISRPQVPGLNKPRPQKKTRTSASGDEEYHYERKTGKARYMSQLDGYLESGLLTREEYQALKKRYEHMDW